MIPEQEAKTKKRPHMAPTHSFLLLGKEWRGKKVLGSHLIWGQGIVGWEAKRIRDLRPFMTFLTGPFPRHTDLVTSPIPI